MNMIPMLAKLIVGQVVEKIVDGKPQPVQISKGILNSKRSQGLLLIVVPMIAGWIGWDVNVELLGDAWAQTTTTLGAAWAYWGSMKASVPLIFTRKD